MSIMLLGTPDGKVLLYNSGGVALPGQDIPVDPGSLEPVSAVLTIQELSDSLVCRVSLGVVWSGSGRDGGQVFQHPSNQFNFVQPGSGGKLSPIS
jgi:hypothetical protein